MNLHCMKRTKMEKKGYDSEVAAPSSVDEDDYPYGLSFSLEKESLDKLGLDIDDFNVGGKAEVICEVDITSLHENANRHNSSSSVTLQITDMAMLARPSKKSKKLKDVLDVLRGED